MDRETAHWLRGQIEAVRILATDVAGTARCQGQPEVASRLQEVMRLCNQADQLISKAMATSAEPKVKGRRR